MTETLPRLGRSNPIQALISVDFPAPFGPTKPVIVPGAIARSIPFKASAPRPYRFATSLADSATVVNTERCKR